MKRMLNRYLSDTSAAVAFESVIIFPLLVWAWIGTFAFFDAYRVYNTSIKATFAIADLVSRQTDTVMATDIEGYGRMLEALIRDTYSVEMRVTQILRDNSGDYLVDWSHATGTQAVMFNANIPGIVDRLPDMANGERVVLVESFVNYRPAFNVGINDITFDNFTLTRPRYAGQVPFFDDINGTTPPGGGGSNPDV